MKKLFTILCVAILTFSVSAQTDQGTFLIGLNTWLGYSNTNITDIDGLGSATWGDAYDEQSSSTLNLNLTDFSALLESVKFGYFIVDNLAIGLGLNFSLDGTNNDFVSTLNSAGTNDVKATTTTFEIEPVVRYYVRWGKGSLFTQFSYGMGSETYSEEWSEVDNPDDVITESSDLGFGIGYSIYVSDHISIEPLVGYNMLTYTEVDGGFSSTGSIVDKVYNSSALSLKIGVTMALYSNHWRRRF